MSRVKAINTFVLSFLNEASDILSQEQIEKLHAKWKKSSSELKTALKPKSLEEKAMNEKPKHFSSAYIFYCAEARPAVKKANPTASATEIISILGSQWKALSATRKATFEKKAKADRVRYDEEMADYYLEHPENKPKPKEKKVSDKPKTPYQLFYTEQRKILSEQGLTGKDLQLAIFAKWKEVKEDKNELQKYKDLASNLRDELHELEPVEEVVQPVVVEEPVEDQAKLDKAEKAKKSREANNKKKIENLIAELDEDQITVEMVIAEAKSRKYKISKESIKKIVEEYLM